MKVANVAASIAKVPAKIAPVVSDIGRVGVNLSPIRSQLLLRRSFAPVMSILSNIAAPVHYIAANVATV